jgi:hypothetical protein
MSPTRVFPLAVLMLAGSAMAQPAAMLALPEPAVALSIDGELTLVSLATAQAPDSGPLGLRVRWGRGQAPADAAKVAEFPALVPGTRGVAMSDDATAIVVRVGTSISLSRPGSSLPLGSSLTTDIAGLNADGSIIAGSTDQSGEPRGFVRAAGASLGPTALLPLAGDDESLVNAISGDGLVCVGVSDTGPRNRAAAVSWLGPFVPGMSIVPSVVPGLQPGVDSEALGVSPDGSTIVGRIGVDAGPGTQTTAFIWNASAGTTLITTPCGGSAGRAIAVDASLGGRVVVGTAWCSPTGQAQALVWTRRTGALPLAQMLANGGGPNFANEDLGEAVAVSGDGLTIAGRTTSTLGGPAQGWVAHIPRLLTCSPADVADTDGLTGFDGGGPDGSVDNGDFQAFFSAFFLPDDAMARLAADVANTDSDPTPDGSIDNGDFQAFFVAFFSPCD